jgi:haloalkane dehalogenase
MDIVRTPEQRFARLPGYPYPASWLAVEEGLRLAYVVEGPSDGRPVLLLHGPPTWSYLWRRAIPGLAEGGCRVVAPDLIGFGRSDKPARPRDHRLDRHTAWLLALIEELDLRRALVVAHGAAAPLALRLVAESGDRLTRMAGVCPRFAPPGERALDEGSAAELIARGCASPITDGARAGYDAPFGEDARSAGLRAAASFLGWPGEPPPMDFPVVAVHGERDENADADWTSRLFGPGDRCRRVTIAGAGHYLPEERGPELALSLLALLAEGPQAR